MSRWLSSISVLDGVTHWLLKASYKKKNAGNWLKHPYCVEIEAEIVKQPFNLVFIIENDLNILISTKEIRDQ